MIKIKKQLESKKELMRKLSSDINNCEKCSLYKTRNKPLIGGGPIDVNIMIVGESPGYYEDLKNKAFVGEAGKILDKLLSLIQLGRDKVYITNILKCHPPKDQNPSRHEIDSCIEYLHKQIDIIEPKIIVTLGKFASREVFTRFNLEFSRISELHGKMFTVKTLFSEIKIIPLYHPAVACYHKEMFNVLKKDFMNLKQAVDNINNLKELGEGCDH